MTNFCTLFDSAYLSRGLLLFDSLKEHIRDFHLYIVTFDKITYDILCRLNHDNMTIISLHEFENENLINIKKNRTKTEYFWTCTSSVLEYCITSYNLSSCTYLDADLYFYGSPGLIFKELNEFENVIITEHRYSKLSRLYEGRRAGRFCVQFVTFTSSNDSMLILKKWIEQCIDWCYDRYEEGKFGDQKYLDTWPFFSNVHIVNHLGAGIAPWNVNKYRFFSEKGKLFGRNHSLAFEILFFHFHYVRINKEGIADLGWNRLSGEVINLFYKPYLKNLLSKEKYLEDLFPNYKRLFHNVEQQGLRSKFKMTIKRILKYNMVDISQV